MADLTKYKSMETIWKDIEGYEGLYQISNNGQIKSIQKKAQSFITNNENKPQVNHIDGNKLNNSINNLEWCTASENGLHSYRIGLSKAPWLGKYGKDNKDSIPVDQYTIDGVFVRSFNGISEASRITGISITAICDACNGRKETAKNFIWKHSIKN